MIVTKMKDLKKIARMVQGQKGVFIVCCGGCPEGFKSGGLGKGLELAALVAERGVQATGVAEIEFLCNKALAGIKLARHAEELRGAGAVLVVSCGIGVQAVGNMADLPALPAMDTVSMGDRQGLWPGAERCRQCGSCMLDRTGGICPITACSKSLVNGTCGGTKNGNCEVDSRRPCGWLLIYKRLEALGRTRELLKMNAPRDYRKYDFPEAKRRSVLYALEFAEQEEAASAGAKSEGAKK
jgi:hypothetical protein